MVSRIYSPDREAARNECSEMHHIHKKQLQEKHMVLPKACSRRCRNDREDFLEEIRLHLEPRDEQI